MIHEIMKNKFSENLEHFPAVFSAIRIFFTCQIQGHVGVSLLSPIGHPLHWMIRGLHKYGQGMARAIWGSVTPPFTNFSSRSDPFPYSHHLRTSKIQFSAAAMLDGGRRHHDPSLEVLGGGLDSYLPVFTTLNRPYDAFPLVGWNRHMETIFASFFRSVPDVRLRRECLRTKDDGAVALDWVSGDDRQLGAESPVLILLVIFFSSNVVHAGSYMSVSALFGCRESVRN